MLFVLSSVFALAGWLINGEFAPHSSIIVIAQSAMIILFYLAIVYVQPYSAGFFVGVLGVHSVIKKIYEPRWTLGLKYGLIAAVAIALTGIIFVAAILLPGFTYKNFTSAEADIEILAVIFLMIFIMQMIFVRHLQGKYSRVLVDSVLKSRIEMVKSEIIPAISELASESEESEVTVQMKENLAGIKADIARHNVMRTDFKSLFGYFPVCIIGPDIKAIKKIL